MITSEIKKCGLCPRNCPVDRSAGQTGYCGCGDKVHVGRVAPHYWEEPCICSEGGSGTVFFCGCNLRCIYCQNRGISTCASSGRELSVSGLADEYLRLQDLNVCNINLVTPTPWVRQIKESLDLSWQRGLWLPVVYNCGGYESVSAVRSLRGYISVYLTDYKYSDGGVAERLSGAGDYPEKALSAIEEMVEQVGEPVFDGEMLKKGVIVRHLVLPGLTDNSKGCIKAIRERLGDSVIYSIMNQYTPLGVLPAGLDRRVTDDEYRRVVSCADGVKYLYIQEGGAADESFIPEWDKKAPRSGDQITSF